MKPKPHSEQQAPNLRSATRTLKTRDLRRPTPSLPRSGGEGTGRGGIFVRSLADGLPRRRSVAPKAFGAAGWRPAAHSPSRSQWKTSKPARACSRPTISAGPRLCSLAFPFPAEGASRSTHAASYHQPNHPAPHRSVAVLGCGLGRRPDARSPDIGSAQTVAFDQFPHPSSPAIYLAVGPSPQSVLSCRPDTSDPSVLLRFVFIRVHSWFQLRSLLICVYLRSSAVEVPFLVRVNSRNSRLPPPQSPIRNPTPPHTNVLLRRLQPAIRNPKSTIWPLHNSLPINHIRAHLTLINDIFYPTQTMSRHLPSPTGPPPHSQTSPH